MSEKPIDRDAQVVALRKALGIEHLWTVVQSILDSVPLVGGSLGGLLGEYIPRARERRLIEFTEALARQLSEVSSLVRQEYLRTDEFAFLFERCYRNVAESYQPECLDTLRNTLVSSTIRFDVQQETKEEYMRLAGALRPSHIDILNFFSDPYQKRYEMKTDLRGGQCRRDVVGMVKQRCFPLATDGLIIALLALLRANGLIVEADTNDKGWGAGRLSSILDLKPLITSFGKGFLEFSTLDRKAR